MFAICCSVLNKIVTCNLVQIELNIAYLSIVKLPKLFYTYTITNDFISLIQLSSCLDDAFLKAV